MKHLTLGLILFCFWLPYSRADFGKIKVSLGDRTTEISLSSLKDKYIFKISPDDLNEHEGVLGEKNFNYVMKRLIEISHLNATELSCKRDQIELQVSQKNGDTMQYTSCLNDKSERSKSLVSLLNTLSIIY